MRTGQKEQAIKTLRLRRSVDKHIASMLNKKYTLEETLIGVQSAQQNAVVFDALKIAQKAGEEAAKRLSL
jgi:hypothetical protein